MSPTCSKNLLSAGLLKPITDKGNIFISFPILNAYANFPLACFKNN